MAPATGRRARKGFTLSELLVVVGVIVVVAAVAVPSFTAIARDLETSKARSDVFAALTAARSRAITSRSMVALHIFRDTGATYTVQRDSPNVGTAGYDQSTPSPTNVNALRWGARFDPTTGLPVTGMPHVPTNQLTMRLEIPNPDGTHAAAAGNAVEFLWPGDHDPIVLPHNVSVCRPGTAYGTSVQTEVDPVDLAFDFYIVFSAEGRIVTVCVDYHLLYDPANRGANIAATDWSASGLCLYDTDGARAALAESPAAWTTFVNQNAVILSPYTGLPLEATTP